MFKILKKSSIKILWVPFLNLNAPTQRKTDEVLQLSKSKISRDILFSEINFHQGIRPFWTLIQNVLPFFIGAHFFTHQWKFEQSISRKCIYFIARIFFSLTIFRIPDLEFFKQVLKFPHQMHLSKMTLHPIFVWISMKKSNLESRPSCIKGAIHPVGN